MNKDIFKADLLSFAKESNHIERIFDPIRDQIHAEALDTFLALNEISVGDLCKFVSSIEPTAKLRMTSEDNVWIGGRRAPSAMTAQYRLNDLLLAVNEAKIPPWEAHVEYEMIHPFMDGNGRSGRALWLWMMRREGWKFELSFKHMFYYQTLDAYSREAILDDLVKEAQENGEY